MLSLLVLVPLAGCALILLTQDTARTRKIAEVCTGLTLILSALFVWVYDGAEGGIQFEMLLPWVPSLGIQFHTGLDGISVMMLLLHSLVSYSAARVSRSINSRVKEYYFFFLLLVAGIYGVFISLDTFFLYMFYELTLIPLFPLIGIWGGKNKEYATMKLTLMITAGAVLALFAILIIYYVAGINSFDLSALASHLNQHPLPRGIQIGCAAFILFGFGVIASLWPFHSWSPIGYAAAPIGVSMIHAGVLKKMGPFLMLRLALPLLPEGVKFWMPIIAVLCVINIVYAGYCAMVQRDLKFIVGFSSVSHMGYVLLGMACLNTAGVSGTVLLMFSHGVMAAAAFALIGFIYEQTHTRDVDELKGGLARQIPFISVCFMMTSMASLGLPGFSNFAAEIMIFFAAWKQYPIHTIIAIFGIVITATYLLRAAHTIFYGPPTGKFPKLRDAVTASDKFTFVLLLSALMLFGIFPNLFLGKIDSTVKPLVQAYEMQEAAHS